MRGKHGNGFGQDGWWRITPADAGKTYVTWRKFQRCRDHPRGCGENLLNALNTTGFQGSPPRMRGKQLTIATTYTAAGITPADAGKTSV